MVDALGNVLPWPGQEGEEEARSQPETRSAEKTAPGEHPTRWVPVAVNLNPGEAVVIKGRLESEDIPVVVQQEAFGSFVGLTVGPMGSAKVLVPEPLAERALAILAETFEGAVEEDEPWDEVDETNDEA